MNIKAILFGVLTISSVSYGIMPLPTMQQLRSPIPMTDQQVAIGTLSIVSAIPFDTQVTQPMRDLFKSLQPGLLTKVNTYPGPPNTQYAFYLNNSKTITVKTMFVNGGNYITSVVDGAPTPLTGTLLQTTPPSPVAAPVTTLTALPTLKGTSVADIITYLSQIPLSVGVRQENRDLLTKLLHTPGLVTKATIEPPSVNKAIQGYLLYTPESTVEVATWHSGNELVIMYVGKRTQ